MCQIVQGMHVSAQKRQNHMITEYLLKTYILVLSASIASSIICLRHETELSVGGKVGERMVGLKRVTWASVVAVGCG